MSTTTTTTTTTASELVPGCRAFQRAEGSHGLPVVPALLVPGDGSQPCAEGDGRHESIREKGGGSSATARVQGSWFPRSSSAVKP